ncbi:BA14K family protein [Ciceribacter sp. RN22]|uniref:BA14K family protein n=1 Tax=Ciceribacter sp. RN22 TaxID=2954932 RepID=UPI002091EBB6|nr:BA14K family protein [Ciceribacter sp. RN22]MCO6177494.1 BA14K family protein [Ciceribacter sp. RN22]
MRIVRRWGALALAVVLALTSYVPVQAAPMAGIIRLGSDATAVDYHYRRPPPRGYYHGYRGYREHRPGYRRHRDGWWYPLAAFGVGMAISGAITLPPPARRAAGINPRHYEWCIARYRSYDIRTNTFQPNFGRRRRCVSPYY